MTKGRDAPAWLLPSQAQSFARGLAALRRHAVACVADPVGSGKTWVGLAIAARWNTQRPTPCLVPAILADQWSDVAKRLDVPVVLHTHERVSRGRLPDERSELVIIDESHRFRVPTTRRYRTLAPWLVGRRALLLTATPIVNGPADLLHQLRLTGRDDTLARFGVPSLSALLLSRRGHPALRHIVIARNRADCVGSVAHGGASGARPRRVARVIRVADPTAARLAHELAALRLSASPDIAALVRTSLLRALASSPAAFRSALTGYRTLLRHAADAADAGWRVTRRSLRAAVGADEAQLVLWTLLGPANEAVELDREAVELDPGDLPALQRLLAAGVHAHPDPKAERLARLLGDRRRSIVFVSHRATVAHLRHNIPALRVAWCTGGGAGVGASRASRGAVLGAFNPVVPAERSAAIEVLVVTDVAAEGLDLQRAERIVHYDLPWTPMRLRQREGRALRLGSAHACVEVVRFEPDPAIEAHLGMAALLRAKRRWPARLGLSGARGAPADALDGPTASRPAQAELVARLTALANEAAVARDRARLDLVDRALAFLRRGHTAGEAMLAASLARCDQGELADRLEEAIRRVRRE
jgi:hypothetical protein